MLHKVFPLLLLLGAIITTAANAQQQELTNIVGQLRIARGDFPAHQILIELRFRGSPITSTYADTQGKFDFVSLVSGEYHIIINDDDYEPVDDRVIIHPDITASVLAFITLRKKESPARADQVGPRASGSNPYLVDPGDYNKRFPKKAIKEYERGLDAEHKGKSDDAIGYYLEALKMSPDYYPAHNNLGSLYLSRSDFKDAEEQFRKAVSLDQNEGQAYFNLGNVLMLTGRYSEAESAVSTGLQRRPDSAFGKFLEGSLLSRSGQFPEAEKTLRESLTLDATLWQAHLQLVNLYMQQ